MIYDPQSAKAAHAAGVGATVTLSLGGKSGIPGDAPYKESFVVEKLSDGKFVAPGPYYGGLLPLPLPHAGSAYNVIPGDASLCGTVRAFDDGVRALIRERMRAICAGIAATFQCEITADIRDTFSVLVNEVEQSRVVEQVARTVVDPSKVITRSQPKMGSEDFADMMQAVPGAYFWVGHEGSVPVHNPGYVLDDKILPIGASMFARIIETRLPVGSHA